MISILTFFYKYLEYVKEIRVEYLQNIPIGIDSVSSIICIYVRCIMYIMFWESPLSRNSMGDAWVQHHMGSYIALSYPNNIIYF